MLRITQSISAPAAKQYFDKALRHADYYRQGSETVGTWYGLAAARLGMTGEVRRSDFGKLIDNIHPLTGEKLTPRTKSDRRVGADFTFNAPKSVSLLHAVTGDERIVDAFRKAVIATMRDIEREVKTRVRAGGKNEDRATGNMIWAGFLHDTTRPVDGVPDPHLHMHAYALNLTFDPQERRWKAAQIGDIKGEGSYYEALFLSRLARYMRGLGFEVERHGRYWDLQGFERVTLEKYSRRTAEIEEAAAKRNITDPHRKSELGKRTRRSKRVDFSEAELRGQWLKRLDARERASLDGAVAKARLGGLSLTRGAAREAAQRAVEHAFERASVVAERRLLAEALIASYGHATPEEVLAEAGRMRFVRGEVEGRRVVTTRAVLAEEEALVRLARESRMTCPPLAKSLSVTLGFLNEQQRTAIEHLWHSSDRVLVVRGGAGTGKTTLMQEAVRGIAAGGRQTRVFAPTAAARDVLKAEGFGGAETLQRLLVDDAMQKQLPQGSVLWVDEAGLISVPEMLKLLKLAATCHVRVILSGDSRQHGSVTRGDALRILEERAGIRAAEVNVIVRQKGAYRDAVEAIAQGQLARSWKVLEGMGSVKCYADEIERLEALSRAYLQAREAGKSVLIVAPTHLEKDRVTAALRHRLMMKGLLDAEQGLPVLKDTRWTEAERGEARRYRPGMVVKFAQNMPGIVRGDRFLVREAGREGVVIEDAEGRARPLDLSATSRFKVYELTRKAFAPGDVIRITEQGETPEGQKLVNGAFHEIARFTKQGDVVLRNGWRLPRAFGHIDHGYVTTSVSSQGRTVDKVIIAMSGQSTAATFHEQFYVSASRARDGIEIFTDDVDAMKRAVARTGARGAALELIEGGLDRMLKPRTRSSRFRDPERELDVDRARAIRDHRRAVADREVADPGRISGIDYQGRIEERAADAGR
ncbi:MAG: MobF family relaxase [Hyphomicrobiales bacterium]|nr:MobF family relaxase [Hyphomicrobiales bacterium]